jgi:hypothetical protein
MIQLSSTLLIGQPAFKLERNWLSSGSQYLSRGTFCYLIKVTLEQ